VISRRTATALALCGLLARAAEAQWQTIEPGGETACSDGSAYRFFVQRGDPAKLLVEFEGGGGCWSADTCQLDIYTRRVGGEPGGQGIYDRANPENPFRDFTHVYVPYCTGDLHWGNAVHNYTALLGPYTMRHKGAANAAAALQWASANVLAPQKLAVAGCSAGGYGATHWAAHLIARYPGASAVHLSDSAAGVAPTGFFQTLIPAWNLTGAAWPNFIPSVALDRIDPSRFGLADLYSGIAGHYPLAAFSQFNHLQDTTQTFFYGLTRGSIVTPQEWSAQMQGQLAAIRAANANFSSYLAPGAQHCIINRPEFYTTQVDGVRFSEWVSRLLASGRPGNVP
jgi:hypothetical protein